MMSMTADVCDLDELKSGLRKKVFWRNLLVDGQVWFASRGGLSGLIMWVVGFDPTLSVQPEEL
jgi:GPH family glycoside/pentoside/hexuronide:cation symporter